MTRRVVVKVDRELCVGSATCVGTDPERFELHEGLSRPRVAEAEEDEDLRDAVEGCPVMAIRLIDSGSGVEAS